MKAPKVLNMRWDDELDMWVFPQTQPEAKSEPVAQLEEIENAGHSDWGLPEVVTEPTKIMEVPNGRTETT